MLENVAVIPVLYPWRFGYCSRTFSRIHIMINVEVWWNLCFDIFGEKFIFWCVRFIALQSNCSWQFLFLWQSFDRENSCCSTTHEMSTSHWTSSNPRIGLHPYFPCDTGNNLIVPPNVSLWQRFMVIINPVHNLKRSKNVVKIFFTPLRDSTKIQRKSIHYFLLYFKIVAKNHWRK